MKRWRLAFILGFLSILYVSLGWRVYNLQIQKGEYYLARAEAREGGGSLISRRGQVFFTDRAGNKIPVALNKEFPVAFTVPSEIDDADSASKAVSEILDLEADYLATVMKKKNDPYEPLADKISESQVRSLGSLSLRGVYVKDRVFRFYPFGRLASHVLGFVGPSDDGPFDVGRYGVESIQESALFEGRAVQLTIDRNIQAQSERILEGLIEKYNASGGTVIVEEPETGKILALGNFPNFNPNNYAESEVATYLNPALQSVYEPGSVFKPITMAIGLDTEAITPETTFYDSGELNLNGYTIKNWDLKAYGQVTMTEVIERSINTGAAFAAKKIGREPFYEYLVRFGFDRETGIDLPGEVVGNLSNLTDHPRDINFATASFGQGVAVTPIELISAFSAIANDGVLMKPYILEATGSEAVGRVVSRRAANQVTDMMVSAVTKAQVAKIPKYKIAGKTGTAQVPDLRRGGYSGEFIHTFVGFAPASSPKFVVLLKLDEPRGVTLAGYTVVPAFRELAEFLINYYSLTPDELPTEAK
jgi:stage V sporulation protein D (sporulation-specific penicillin-binding protein)